MHLLYYVSVEHTHIVSKVARTEKLLRGALISKSYGRRMHLPNKLTHVQFFERGALGHEKYTGAYDIIVVSATPI